MTSTAIFERWRRDPASFIEEVLVNPETGKPFVLLPAERIFIKNAFTLGDDGRLVYWEWVYSCPKKSGKTGFAAMMQITTLFLFGGRYGEGFTLANDLEQSVGRVFEAIKRILVSSPLLANEVKITADKITFIATNATITPLASDAASAAGGHPVISTFDELFGYVSERGRRLFDEMVPVPTRKISARLTVTYAGYSGESQLLEDLYKRGMAQPEIGPDLRAGDGILFFWSHVPIAPWQDEAWLAQMRRSLRPNQYLRMIENRWTSIESTFIDMAWWDACVNPDLRSVVVDRGLSVWCAVDASVKRDSTAIVAVTWSAKDQRVRLVNHAIIQPSADRPVDFEAEVEQILLDWSRRYHLKCVFFDPYQMISSSQRLTREGLLMVEYAQTVPNLTESSQNLFDLIKGRNLVTYPSADIRLAISRAVAIETPRGWRIGKDKQVHKIDVVVALAMACLAATKREYGVKGYPFSVWAAVVGEVDLIDDPDGSREWRNRRCPPSMCVEEWMKRSGPNAPGAVPLGDGAYRAATLLERWQIEAEARRAAFEKSGGVL